MGGSGTGAGSGTGGAGPCKEAPLGCEGIAASACKHEWDVCAQAPACLCAFRCVGADQSGNQSAALVNCEIKYSVGTGPLDALVNCAKTVAPNCFAFK